MGREEKGREGKGGREGEGEGEEKEGRRERGDVRDCEEGVEEHDAVFADLFVQPEETEAAHHQPYPQFNKCMYTQISVMVKSRVESVYVPPKKPEEMYPADAPPPRFSCMNVTIQPTPAPHHHIASARAQLRVAREGEREEDVPPRVTSVPTYTSVQNAIKCTLGIVSICVYLFSVRAEWSSDGGRPAFAFTSTTPTHHHSRRKHKYNLVRRGKGAGGRGGGRTVDGLETVYGADDRDVQDGEAG